MSQSNVSGLEAARHQRPRRDVSARGFISAAPVLALFMQLKHRTLTGSRAMLWGLKSGVQSLESKAYSPHLECTVRVSSLQFTV